MYSFKLIILAKINGRMDKKILDVTREIQLSSLSKRKKNYLLNNAAGIFCE